MMDRWLAAVFACSLMWVPLVAQSEGRGAADSQLGSSGDMPVSVANAVVTATGDTLTITRKNRALPITVGCQACSGTGVLRENDTLWALPTRSTKAPIDPNEALWLLPVDAGSNSGSWFLAWHGTAGHATWTEDGIRFSLDADSLTASRSEARPHSDLLNHRFSINLADGSGLGDALAGFYWGTMIPLDVEKTMAANFPYSSGYVLSTLKTDAYAGSYPAVDHEFQIAGRLAMGSEFDLDLVRRMIELQFKLMDDDPERLHRAPTSVQPDGRREYHIRRDSKDARENAAMFPLTGNIEVIGESWHYYEATKDLAWLRRNIIHLEEAAAWTMASVDPYGRVWSDVYYEDQVIKDGRETEAQAFAAHSFESLAAMEKLLGRPAQASQDTQTAKKLIGALVAPLPLGYWDAERQRFTDWVDRNGVAHDHVHLVANTLPVTLGYATPTQAKAVEKLVASNAHEFERFPSFVAADIEAYTPSEMGVAGPYDLSAAGRYWYWDAAFRTAVGQNGVLLDQLKTVAKEGAKSNYYMGERYDMDHVYYVDGKNAHGAEQYFEYPCVFTAVLVSQFLGLSLPADADVAVTPHITGYGSVDFETPAYALAYVFDKKGFLLANHSEKQRRFKVDLSSLGQRGTHYELQAKAQRGMRQGDVIYITLDPHEEARWIAAP